MRSWQATSQFKIGAVKARAGRFDCPTPNVREARNLLLAIANSEPGIALEALENLGVCIAQLKEAILTQISSLPTGDRID